MAVRFLGRPLRLPDCPLIHFGIRSSWSDATLARSFEENDRRRIRVETRRNFCPRSRHRDVTSDNFIIPARERPSSAADSPFILVNGPDIGLLLQLTIGANFKYCNETCSV